MEIHERHAESTTSTTLVSLLHARAGRSCTEISPSLRASLMAFLTLVRATPASAAI